jgi:hypothetical protein
MRIPTLIAVVAVAAWTPVVSSETDRGESARTRRATQSLKLESVPAEPGPSTMDALKSNVLECVDPPIGPPPATLSFTPTAISVRATKASSGMTLSAGGQETVSFKSSGAASKLKPDVGTGCRENAVFEFWDGGVVLNQMPPVNYPDMQCSEGKRCIEATRSWIHAHHNVWIARQVIHHIAARDHVEQRKYLWRQPGLDANNDKKLGEETSPEYWFGPYSENRFKAVKEGIDDLWSIMTTNKTGGISIHLKCPAADEEPGNVCNTVKPAAHHWVKGYVNLCGSFFDSEKNDDWGRSRLVSHELMHHLWVKYGNIWVAIQDKHYHGHKIGCGINPGSESAYGEDKIRHLATYENSNDNDCGHPARNVRNNDTYAYFITTLGDMVYDGEMTNWPYPADPTPQPPNCQGGEGCLCDPEQTWPMNAYFEPDGDYSSDQWCDDNDGEMTCMAKKFGVTIKGVCSKCDEVRGAGCECDDGQPCEEGSCFGDDTFNGGVGHCFDDAPAWACLADCERLFNDEAAWCYADYPTGQARCMDNLCTEPKAWECNQAGKVCRYGDCVVECGNNTDCQVKGYPDYYQCQQSRCEHGV